MPDRRDSILVTSTTPLTVPDKLVAILEAIASHSFNDAHRLSLKSTESNKGVKPKRPSLGSDESSAPGIRFLAPHLAKLSTLESQYHSLTFTAPPTSSNALPTPPIRIPWPFVFPQSSSRVDLGASYRTLASEVEHSVGGQQPWTRRVVEEVVSFAETRAKMVEVYVWLAEQAGRYVPMEGIDYEEAMGMLRDLRTCMEEVGPGEMPIVLLGRVRAHLDLELQTMKNLMLAQMALRLYRIEKASMNLYLATELFQFWRASVSNKNLSPSLSGAVPQTDETDSPKKLDLLGWMHAFLKATRNRCHIYFARVLLRIEEQHAAVAASGTAAATAGVDVPKAKDGSASAHHGGKPRRSLARSGSIASLSVSLDESIAGSPVGAGSGVAGTSGLMGWAASGLGRKSRTMAKVDPYTCMEEFYKEAQPINISLIYLVSKDEPFLKGGYALESFWKNMVGSQRGEDRQNEQKGSEQKTKHVWEDGYVHPTGLNQFPAICSYPTPEPPMEHWPNVVMLLQTNPWLLKLPKTCRGTGKESLSRQQSQSRQRSLSGSSSASGMSGISATSTPAGAAGSMSPSGSGLVRRMSGGSRPSWVPPMFFAQEKEEKAVVEANKEHRVKLVRFADTKAKTTYVAARVDARLVLVMMFENGGKEEVGGKGSAVGKFADRLSNLLAHVDLLKALRSDGQT